MFTAVPPIPVRFIQIIAFGAEESFKPDRYNGTTLIPKIPLNTSGVLSLGTLFIFTRLRLMLFMFNPFGIIQFLFNVLNPARGVYE